MEIKGIDVSEWQENIDFAKVKKAGIKFVILRAGVRKRVDNYFYRNVNGFKKAGIDIPAVYFFSYAKTKADPKKEAKLLIKYVKKAGLPKSTILIYDFEYDTVTDAAEHGVKLGKSECIQFTKIFCDYVKSKGYTPGVYCNLDYYKNMYNKETLSKYILWLADYTGGPNYPCTYQQYTSDGHVPGIKDKVDMNYYFGEQEKEEAPVKDLWTQTAELMAEQTGYCEKRSDSQLDHKTANAGFNNYTKYARDVNSWGQPGCQGQPWCAVYQFWLCVKIFGLARALQIMGGGFYNCVSITSHAKANGTWHKEPKLGALVIFRNGSHVGRVTKVTASHIYTNEGNTSKSGQNNIIANGGSVCDKVYTRDYSGIDGYVWIDYSTGSDASSTTTASELSKTPKWVGRVTAAELNVRSWAGIEFPNIKKWPKLSKGNLVDVCDAVTDSQGDIWYYIRIADKYYGFVHGDYIKRQ